VEKFVFNVEKFFPPDSSSTVEMSKNLIDEKLGSIKAVKCCSIGSGIDPCKSHMQTLAKSSQQKLKKVWTKVPQPLPRGARLACFPASWRQMAWVGPCLFEYLSAALVAACPCGPRYSVRYATLSCSERPPAQCGTPPPGMPGLSAAAGRHGLCASWGALPPPALG
jgi:hypothetical protein